MEAMKAASDAAATKVSGSGKQYVTRLNSNDVLLGRGAPSIENEGNVRFRQLVQSRKREYIITGKRQLKDLIARQVIQAIAMRGGRFVRKIESLVEAEDVGVPEGSSAWLVADDDTILQKVKQALRDRDTESETLKELRQKHGEEAKGLSPLNAPSLADLSGGPHSLPGLGSTQSSELAIRDFIFNQYPHRDLLGDIQRADRIRAVLDGYQGMRTTGNALPFPTSNPSLQGIVHDTANLQSPSSSTPFPFGPGRRFGETQSLDVEASTRRVVFSSAGSVLPSRSSDAFPLALRNQPYPGIRSREDAALQGLGKDRGMSPFKSPMRGAADEARDETTGDKAIRRAFDKAAASKTAGSELDVTLSEVFLLSVLCSHGLPCWSPLIDEQAFKLSTAASDSAGSFTWMDFAGLVVQAAGNWLDRKGHVSVLDTGAEVERKALMLTLLGRNDPQELAKKTLMLLEKMQEVESDKGKSAAPFKDDTSAKDYTNLQIRKWFNDEMMRWAATLKIAELGGRPLPFSAVDFVGKFVSYQDDPSFALVARFDVPSARDILHQVSYLSSLRSVVYKSTPTFVQTCVKKADASFSAWTKKPSWWGRQDSPEQKHHDVLLVERLVTQGYLGVLSDSQGFLHGSMDALGNAPTSLRQVGLTKAAVEERISQICVSMHEARATADSQQIFEERLDRFIAGLAAVRGTTTQQLLAEALMASRHAASSAFSEEGEAGPERKRSRYSF